MTLPTLTIDSAIADQLAVLVGSAQGLLQEFSPRTAQKGRSRRGGVGSLQVTADGCLEALVRGSDPAPYEVHVGLLDPDESDCDCPVGDGGGCKHAWAVVDRFSPWPGPASSHPSSSGAADPRAPAPPAARRVLPPRHRMLLIECSRV